MAECLRELKAGTPLVHDTRQCGFVAGIEFRRIDGTPFPADQRFGAKICLEARNHGLLTRPIRDTVVLMPPLCTSGPELELAVSALRSAAESVAAASCRPPGRGSGD
jgi:adenosylmethionine-8-amino-7-oxononanoate aminotransferase